MPVYLTDGYARTSVRAATLRKKLQIKRVISHSHSILTPGPGRVATGVPVFKALA